jgi:uncharacterized protein (TIGR02118 family)
MQKIVAAIPLRGDMDRAEALRYWREVHGPIVARLPGLRKYVQNHAMVAPQNDRQFDGTVELYFDSMESFQAATQTPEWRAVIEDAARFCDESRLWLSPAEEIPIV